MRDGGALIVPAAKSTCVEKIYVKNHPDGGTIENFVFLLFLFLLFFVFYLF